MSYHLQDLNTRLTKFELEADRSKNRISVLESELEDTKARLAKSEKEVTQYKIRASTLEDDLKSKNAASESLKAEHDSEIARLHDEKSVLQKELDSRHHCEVLLDAGREEEAVEEFHKIIDGFSPGKAVPKWVRELQARCVNKLVELGDKERDAKKYGKAITWYSTALSLQPPNQVDILVKRSEVHGLNGSWNNSLVDAEEALKLNPRSIRGMERKLAALRALDDADAEGYISL